MMEDLTDMTQEEKYLQWMEEYFRQEGGDDLKRDLIIYSDTGKLLTVWASMVYGRVGMYVRNYMRNAHPEIDSEFEYGKFEDYSWELIQKLVEKWKADTQNVEVQDVDIKYSQEDKKLLLKDICARLPYGVKVLYDNQIFEVQYIEPMYEEIKLLDNENYTLGIDEVKPYLFPMSYIDDNEKLFAEYITTLTYDSNTHSAAPTIKTLDFFNKYHIDYRGLIEKRLAIDATGKNI